MRSSGIVSRIISKSPDGTNRSPGMAASMSS
jgi:hypothetical protein